MSAYPDLGLTDDEVVARYLRVIADGPECAAKLREQGFETWCQTWWEHHATARDQMRRASEALGRDPGPPMDYEWDSRNYDVESMRYIYDQIILHASRTGAGS